MKRLPILLLALVLVTVFAVSCNPQLEDTDAVASISFEEVASKALNATTTTYSDSESSNYVWYYTATKADTGNTIKYGATGDTITRVGSGGKLSEAVGPFSLGYWTFTLYGYSTEKITNVGGTATTNSTEYTFKGSTTVLVEKQKAGKDQTVQVVIKASQTEQGKGTLVIDKTIALADKAGTVYKKDNNNLTLTSFSYQKKDGDSTTVNIGTTTQDSQFTISNLASGEYTVTVEYAATETVGAETAPITYASNTITVNVYDGLTTTVSGTLDEYTQTVVFETKSQITVSKTISQASDFTDTVDTTEKGIKFAVSPLSTKVSEDSKITYVYASSNPTISDKVGTVSLTTYGAVTEDSTFVLSATTSDGSTVKYGWKLDLTDITVAEGNYIIIKSYVGTDLTVSAFQYKSTAQATSYDNGTKQESAPTSGTLGNWYYDSSSGYIYFVAKVRQ